MQNKIITFDRRKREERDVVVCKILKNINGKTAFELLENI